MNTLTSVTMNKNKIYAFDYMLTLFEEWKQSLNTKNACKALSKLSVLKLLFLVAAPKKDNGLDLLDVFNNFHALPYGPVESDIYNAIQNDDLPSYNVGDRFISLKKVTTPLPYTVDGYCNIKQAVDELRCINNGLIELNAFELVEITHKWDSWNKSIDFAHFIGASSYKMTTQAIRNDKSRIFS